MESKHKSITFSKFSDTRAGTAPRVEKTTTARIVRIMQKKGVIEIFCHKNDRDQVRD